jgi:hypothetical protein
MRKDIEGFENYCVDESGVVYNKTRNRALRSTTNKCGYVYVSLYKCGKAIRKRVHRLVAEAFVQNPLNLPQVNHKDEDKQNNSIANLEWCTAQYNNHYGQHQPTAHAIEARKKAVLQYLQNGEFVARYESASEAQRKTGIHQANISKCCLQRKHYETAGGFVWKFEEIK